MQWKCEIERAKFNKRTRKKKMMCTKTFSLGIVVTVYFLFMRVSFFFNFYQIIFVNEKCSK